MNALKHTFSNGLRLLTIPMPSLTSATVSVWVGVGSRYESQDISGISHFLEHMVFKGGKKYPSAKIISETIDAMGAEFNASTSQEVTNFYIKTQTNLLPKAFDVLSDMVLSPLLNSEELEKERGVIIEELNMYEDNPMYKIGNLYDELLYAGNPLGWDIGGNKKTVGEQIKKSNFDEYLASHYHSKNMVITVAGGIDEKQSIELVEKYFSGIRNGDKRSDFSPFIKTQTAPRMSFAPKKIEQAHFIIGHFGRKLDSNDKYVESVLETILGGNMSSRLFTQVREKRGLCYTVRTSSDHYLDTGSIGTYTGTDPKKAVEALKVILEELQCLAQNTKRITKSELQKAKDYEKGHIALSLENTRSVGGYFGYEETLLGKHTSVEEDFAGIDRVTEEEVVALAKELFVTQNMNLAVVGPFEDGNEFEKVLKSH